LTTDAFRPRLTAEGKTHPITSLVLDGRDNADRWGKLPALEGLNRVPRTRVGATTLLAHPTQKTGDGKPAPVLVVGDAGKGRALALLTDSAWHWGFVAAGEGDDGGAFQRFWGIAISRLVLAAALALARTKQERRELGVARPVAALSRAVEAVAFRASEV